MYQNLIKSAVFSENPKFPVYWFLLFTSIYTDVGAIVQISSENLISTQIISSYTLLTLQTVAPQNTYQHQRSRRRRSERSEHQSAADTGTRRTLARSEHWSMANVEHGERGALSISLQEISFCARKIIMRGVLFLQKEPGDGSRIKAFLDHRSYGARHVYAL